MIVGKRRWIILMGVSLCAAAVYGVAYISDSRFYPETPDTAGLQQQAPAYSKVSGSPEHNDRPTLLAFTVEEGQYESGATRRFFEDFSQDVESIRRSLDDQVYVVTLELSQSQSTDSSASELARTYGITALPSAVLLDEEGNCVDTYAGHIDHARLVEAISELSSED